MIQASAANVLRRVLVASITGSLPDENREAAVGLLVAAINAPDDDVRGLAVIALSEIGVGAPVMLPVLTDALQDSSEIVRKRAARALGELGIAAVAVIPHLSAGLRDESLNVRLECTAALGRIGPDAEPAMPALFALLVEPDVRVRTVAAAAIRQLGRPALNYALEMLADPDPLMRERSCDLLGQIRCLDDRVVEALLEASIDREVEVRVAARHALERLQQNG
jgi:HEAT repeat protein